MEDKENIWRPTYNDEILKVYVCVAVLVGMGFIVGLIDFGLTLVTILWPFGIIVAILFKRITERAYLRYQRRKWK